jgi:RNA recognition motif-containing protein
MSLNLAEFPKLFVGNLPAGIPEDALRDMFMEFGNVMDIHVMYNKGKDGPNNLKLVSVFMAF